MNEQDERVIYEWLKPELKGKPWPIEAYHCVGCGFPWQEARYEEPSKARTLYTRMTLPPLDMNTAFGECIPKLYDARCTITFTRSGVDYGYLSGSWRIMWGDDAGRMHGAVNPDFYAALLDYIKRVQG